MSGRVSSRGSGLFFIVQSIAFSTSAANMPQSVADKRAWTRDTTESRMDNVAYRRLALVERRDPSTMHQAH
jgi:hypothetical protein